jgi:hypothetical protein
VIASLEVYYQPSFPQSDVLTGFQTLRKSGLGSLPMDTECASAQHPRARSVGTNLERVLVMTIAVGTHPSFLSLWGRNQFDPSPAPERIVSAGQRVGSSHEDLEQAIRDDDTANCVLGKIPWVSTRDIE